MKNISEKVLLFNTILACLDGSSLAEQILPYVTEMALLSNSKVVLLEVVSLSSDVTPTVPGVDPITLPSMSGLDQLQEEEKEAKDYLEGIAQPLQRRGVKVEGVVRQGMPGDVIVAYAEEIKADIIAIATHGRSGLGRLFFGSVAEHVLKESGLPILMIKPR
ncbi:MAG: universal stress protein [Chloroflexota bacterium]|nr:universal stress protein [Chloroflexota bacterium]